MNDLTNMDVLHETQFVPLQSQSNVFGMVEIPGETSSSLLIATLRHGVFLTGYKERKRPVVSSVPFSYLPTGSDVDIIALDAFRQPPHGVIVGIALVKGSEDTRYTFLNVYGLSIDQTQVHTWNDTADDWLSFPLKFTPFKLTHTSIIQDGELITVFLLSGTDRKVHLFMKSKGGEFHEEDDCENFFPELQDFPSSVTAMSFRNHSTTRFSAVGCQNGFLKCACVDMQSATVLKEWSHTGLSGPLSVVKLFSLNSQTIADTSHVDSTNFESSMNYGPCVHILVCSAVELANVYCDVQKCGFTKCLPLPQATVFDSILCADVSDVNWDRKNEIILGTFGKRILVYQAAGDGESFELQHVYQVAFPVHGLKYCDVIGDGFRELTVLSTRGVHIFQHSLQEGIKFCISRLKAREAKEKQV